VSSIVTQRGTQLTSVSGLHFPSDLPKYYMTMSISTFSRNSLFEIGTSQTLSTISLPLPDQMLDNNQVRYDERELSATVGNIVNNNWKGFSEGAGKIASSIQSGGVAGGAGTAWDTIKNTVTSGDFWTKNGMTLLAGVAIDKSKVVRASALTDAFKMVTGYSPNYFLTVLLNGPQYKTHVMSWTLSARSPQEAASLTSILRTMKNAQAPGIAAGGALFTFPRVFRLAIQPDRNHFFQYKPAVLMDLSVNYAEGGQPSVRGPRTQTGNQAAPTAVTITAVFKELEFWLRSDFGSDTDPNGTLPGINGVGGDGGGRNG
jgi:hypothetical protein